METAKQEPRAHAEDPILVGGGTMGTLLRAYAWAATPLGPVCEWLPSLCTVVRLCLTSRFPTVIFWGPELRMLYNDAYVPILADKHPKALGHPACEVWPEIWSIIGPMLEGVLTTGKATWSDDLLLPIVHNGTARKHYFTFSYSPIQDENGQVGGVFCPVTETTERVERERREQALRYEAEAARDQLALTLESMSDSFVAFDREWRITRVNASAAAAMHHRREDLLGKIYWEAFPPTRETNLYPEFQRVMTDRVPSEFESYYPPWERWYAVHAYPMVEGGLSVFFRDITARKHAEEVLRAQERRLRELVNLVPEMVWEAAPDGTMTTVSERWLAYTGLTEAQLARDWPKLVLHPDDLERCVIVWTQALAHGVPYEVEVRNRRYDGQYRWFLTRAVPLRDAEGQLTAWYGATVDIHDRKLLEMRLQENEARLLMALDTVQAGSFAWDIPTGTVHWSPLHFTILGIEPGSVTPDYHAWHNRIHPEDVSQVDARLAEALTAHRDIMLEYRVVRADGSIRWVQSNGHVTYDTVGSPLRMVGLMMDITARKQAEEEQTRLVAELQRVNAELQQFAYIVSHDLNEPLRTMRNYVQLLARQMKGKLEGDTEEYMAFVTDAAQRMQQLLSDLLAYTRAGQTLELQPVDCEAVLAQILNALQAHITEGRAVITYDPLPTVQGDATRLGQVLQNLIGNALKFRAANPPRIHIAAVKQDANWQFSVRDNGIGIDPQQLGKLFQVFARAHGKEYAGSGIGLAICKRVVEQHGGRIWVESRPGEGSIFYFTVRDNSTRCGKVYRSTPDRPN